MLELKLLNKTDYSAKEKITRELSEKFPNSVRKILLVNPPQTTRDVFDVKIAKIGNYPCYQPYNIALLSRALEERGYQTKLLDMNYEVLREAYDSNGEFNFNTIWEGIFHERLDKFKPDLVGISCMFTMNYPEVKALADYVKQYNPKIPVITGGGYPALAAEETLRNSKGSIDFVSLFESDNSFPDMIDFINKKVDASRLSQLATLIDNNFVSLDKRDTPSEEIISKYPNWQNLPIGDYSRIGKIGVYGRWIRGEDIRCSTISSTRGCIAHCDFCSVREFNGKGVRRRSIESVIGEIEDLRDKYGVKHLVWLDDDLISDTRHVKKLFEEMAKRNLGVTWDASNGVIAAFLNRDVAQLAEASGCIGMSFGLESGDPKILHEMRKPGNIHKYVEAAQIMREYHPNIFSKGFLIIGYPGETLGQIWNTIGLANKMHLDWYSIHVALPIPQTDMARKIKEAEQMETGSIVEESSQSRFMYGFGNVAAREYEKKRKTSSVGFFNILLDKPREYVPTRAELKDIWFLTDYYINYQNLANESHPIKLALQEKWLEEICEKRSEDNPLGNLYLAIIREKLGKKEKARINRNLAEKYINESEFWSTRFNSLGLYDLLKAS